VKKKKKIKQLAWREYLPLAATAAMWAVIIIAIGHADAARLLAAVTFVRGTQLMMRFATPTALKLRIKAPPLVRRQAKRLAFHIQASALIAGLIVIALLVETMKSIGQDQVAAYLPFLALGMPARHLRLADVKTASPYYRLALTGSGLVTASVAWAFGWPATLFALAFGAREWIAYLVLRWWPREPRIPKQLVELPLKFEEVARYSVILGRRLLTYRLTKSLLAVFGPFGNAAARTGRGLNWHSRLEPYIPHHLGGFIGFILVAFGAAAFLAVRSGEPAAMIVAAGLYQVSGAAMNVVLLWRWLPDRDADIPLFYDDDDE
jgi:hypothetical protein